MKRRLRLAARPYAPGPGEGPPLDAGQFLAVFDTMDFGACLVGLDGRLLETNRAYQQLLGYGAEELRGTHFADYTHPDDLPANLERFREQIEQRARIRFQKRYLRKDGSTIWVEVSGAPVLDAHGEPLLFFGAVHDVTERLQAEAALRESEERYRTLVEHAPEALLVIDVEAQRFVEANENAVRLFGLPREELLTRRPGELSPAEQPDGRDAKRTLWEAIQAAVAGEAPVLEWVVRSASGEEIPTEIRYVRLPAAGRTLVCGSVVDISERKLAEAALRESEERYRTLVEHAPEAILVIDVETGRFVDANENTLLLFGLSREELLSRAAGSLSRPVQPDGRPAREIMLESIRAAAGGEVPVVELVALTSTGEEFPVEIRLARLPAAGRTLVRVTITDIREHRRAEQALRESEARFRTLFQSSPIGICLLDSEGHAVQTNRAFQELVGYSADELRGMRFEDVTHPDSLPLHAELWEELQAGKRDRFELEKRYVRKDGATVWGRLTATAVRAAEGKPLVFTMVEDVTERRLGEDALRESEERYRALIEHGPEAILVIDVDTRRFVDANENALRLNGLSREELLRRGPGDLSPPTQPDGRNSKDVLWEAIDAAAAGETPVLDWSIRNATGEEIPIELRYVRLPAAGRTLVRSSAVDISARRRVEQALRDSEARFRALFETAQVGLLITDLEGRYLETNVAFQTMLGRSAEELRGSSFTVYTHPDDVAPSLEFISSLEGARRLRIEKRYLRADGGVVHADLSSAVLRDAEGRPQLLFGAAVDITERKRAETALRESEEFFRTVFEESQIGMRLTGLDGVSLKANRAFERMVGYSAAELAEMHFSEYTHPNDRARNLELWEALRSGRTDRCVFEKRYVRKDGGIVRSHLVDSLIRDAEGTPRFAVTFDQDITEQRALEEQLREAQKLEAIGRLAGGVAHDFNNLLTAILGHSSFMLERLRDDEPLRQEAEHIRSAADRAAGLTGQLLAFSRRQLLQPRVLDLNAIVEAALALLRRAIGEDVRLVTVLAPELGNVRADRGQLEQVVMNLALNARDAMPEGGSLTIETADAELDDEYARTHVGVAPGRYVMLAVSDTGVGMDEGTRSRIFEPFFTTKRHGEGTGLGLATVYGVVEQSGGHVAVESEVGGGTAFRVYLPRAEEVLPAEAADEGERSGEGSETILLVEDEDVVRRLVGRILAGSGYTVLEASHGAEALELARERGDAIDLVVTDVVMPGLSGPELAERLLTARPGLKVLFISGYADRSRPGERNLLAADLPSLGKPFTPAALVTKVREVLDGAPGRA